MNAIQTAISRFPGGQAALARKFGISAQAVNQWNTGRRPVPAKFCPALEADTGVRCEELREDLVWTRNEAGEVTGHHVRISAA